MHEFNRRAGRESVLRTASLPMKHVTWSSVTVGAMARGTAHLIGGYGLFWQRSEVFWRPGHGNAWQLLGRRGVNRGSLRVCDFRQARGFYILFDDYGASYVGLARGEQGIGQRLKVHESRRQDWSRFCWFSFDDVVHSRTDGWSTVKRRDAVAAADAETTVRELEALLIQILGTRRQNQMRFISGLKWRQVTLADCQPGGALAKVDTRPLVQPEYRRALEELSL